MARKEEYFTMDKITRDYLNEIRQIPLLTIEEEEELGKRIASGDKEAENILVKHNLRLVIPVAEKYARISKRPFLDIIQDGNIGLMSAAEKFDISMEYKFSTYATYWIRQEILKAITNTNDMIRVPSNLYYFSKRMLQVKKKLKKQNGYLPSINEIALEMHEKVEKIELAEQAQYIVQIANDVESLYSPIPNCKDVLVEETIVYDHVQTPEDWLYDFMNENELHILMNNTRLTKKEKTTLELRYGLKDGNYKTQNDVGVILGVTRMRAGQLERRALQKLRESADHLEKKVSNPNEKPKELVKK